MVLKNCQKLSKSQGFEILKEKSSNFSINAYFITKMLVLSPNFENFRNFQKKLAYILWGVPTDRHVCKISS